MAEKKNVTPNIAPVAETVPETEFEEVMLPIIPDPKAPQVEFYSFNFKNYLIQRGVKVRVPKELKAIIDEQERARTEAFAYIMKKALREPK